MKKFLLFASALFAGYSASAQTYTPITVTGFNADIVANGSGNSTSSSTFPVDAPGDNYCFVAQGFVNSLGQSPTTFLPANGVINSVATTGLPFQLASYSGNNSLRVVGGTSGTLTFATPSYTNQVCVLATSGYPSISTATVNFTDGTNQAFTGNSLPNWYDGTGFAIKGVSRVNRNNDQVENDTNNPRIYQFILNLSAANAVKMIQSITFNNTTTSPMSYLHVMAVTTKVTAPAVANDVAVTAISGVNSGCGLTSQETVTITVTNMGTASQSNIPVSYQINGTGPIINEVVAGPIASGASATYTFTAKANLSTLGSYSIVAKTNLTGDATPANDALTKTVTSAAVPNTPTITTSGAAAFCPGGSVVLTAASTSTGVSYQWALNGVDISGATAATYTANTAGSYTAKAIVTGTTCASQASTATAVTVNTVPSQPSINPNGTASFCPGASVTLTATTTTPGVTYVWSLNGTSIAGATAATYIANAAGSYTVKATLNGCLSGAATATVVSQAAKPSTPTISQSGGVLTSSSASGNQWYKDGVLITGATNKTYTLTSNGAYTVIVTNGGCSSSASAAFNILAYGIGADIAGLDVKVYPNPSNGLFNITLPQGKGYEMTVTDLTGKVVKQLSANDKNTTLNISNAAKGIYILKIVGEGKTATRKIEVQ